MLMDSLCLSFSGFGQANLCVIIGNAIIYQTGRPMRLK